MTNCMKTNLLTMIIVNQAMMMTILLTRKVNLIMSLGVLAGLVIHVSFVWLIDMVIIIVIIVIVIIVIFVIVITC